MDFRRTLTKVLLPFIFLVLAAGAACAADAPVYGGTLRWHEVANPPKLDPHMATDTTSARVTLQA